MTAEMIFRNNESNRPVRWKLENNRTLVIEYKNSDLDKKWQHIETRRAIGINGMDTNITSFKKMVQKILIDDGEEYTLLKLNIDVID